MKIKSSLINVVEKTNKAQELLKSNKKTNNSTDSEYNNRVINLFGAFNEENINKIMEKLLKWEEEDIEILYQHSQQINQVSDPSTLLKPIVININSPGGYVKDLFAMVDLLESMNTTVITRGFGDICSCGFILFCIGDKRYIGNNASLMYHEVSYGIYDKHTEIKNYQEFNEKLQNKIDKLISKKTGLKMKQLKAWREQIKDKWIDAKEAVELGIATDYLY